MSKRVLIVADVQGWAFDRIVHGLRKYCRTWKVGACYLRENPVIDHRGYDVILYLCDWLLDPLYSNKLPREKVVLAIRQAGDIGHAAYQTPGELERIASILAVSNQGLWLKYKGMHSQARVAPGGVDTEVFRYTQHQSHNPPRVGYAGSFRCWGKDFRGLDILEEACNRLGYDWRPALREDRMRSVEEMVRYYQTEIDIYADLSKTAGRQNGLLEAGACGLPIVSSDAGIARELIVDGLNGYICDRTADELKNALSKTCTLRAELGQSIRKTIDIHWSWNVQALLFEDLFDEILGS